jgi:regulation of enolase protein 1 (concanavalin A-like superfamily)
MKHARSLALMSTLALLAFGLSLPARAAIPGWSDKTFGDTVQGSATVDGSGNWTVKGAGADTWDRQDEFHIVYKPLAGDGSTTTRLLNAEEGVEWSKIGCMMRNDLTNNAAQAMEVHMTTGHGGELVFRGVGDPENGDSNLGSTRMSKDEKVADGGGELFPRKFPMWIKIERRGDGFTGFASEDGANWIPVTRTQRIKMQNEIVAGVFVCSHDDDNLLTGTFDGKVTEVSNKLLKPEEATPPQADPVVTLGGNNAVLLMWDRVNHLGKEADGYVVYRAKAGESDFTKLKELPGDQTSYMDDTIKNGEAARYRVHSIVKVGPNLDKVLETKRFTQRLVEVTGAPNAPIKIGDRDFFANILDGGSPEPYTDKPGSVTEAGGVVTVKASGWDIQNKADGGEQLMTPVSGDFTFTARVLGVPSVDGGDVNEWAKFGIAVRESTMSESRYAGMLITPQHGIRSPHRRLFTLGWSDDMGPNEDTPTFPIYFRIQRRGDEVKAFTSADGKTFAEYGNPATSVLPGLKQNVYVGLIGTAHDNDQVAQAKFDQLTLITP